MAKSDGASKVIQTKAKQKASEARSQVEAKANSIPFHSEGHTSTCLSCEQTTGQWDRQNDPKKKVRLSYIKTMMVKSGKKYVRRTSGNECHPCFHVRRKICKSVPQKDLNEARTKDKTLDEKFWEHRGKYVKGENMYEKVEPIDIKYVVEKSQVGYKNRFVERTITPIYEFTDKRRITYKDEADLIRIVKQRFPSCEVGYDEDGTLAVDVPEQSGSEYRYKRGVLDQSKFHTCETCESKESAVEAFDAMSDKMNFRAEEGRLRAVCEAFGEEEQPDSDEGDAFDNGVEEDAECGTTSVVSLSSNSKVTGTSLPSIKAPSAKSQVGACSEIVSKVPGCPKACRGRKPSRCPPNTTKIPQAQAPEDDAQSETQQKSRRSKYQRTMDEASEAIDRILAEFTPDNHCENQRQTKNVEETFSVLQKWGKSCGVLEGESAEQLPGRCFQACEMLEGRQMMLSEFRDKFEEKVRSNMSVRVANLCKQVPVEKIAGMVTKSVEGISEKALDDANTATALHMGLSLDKKESDFKDGFCLHIILDPDITAALACHRSATRGQIEKILKRAHYSFV